MLIEALEGDDVSTARVPALRLENVLKVTPMFQQSLRELSTGIQGVPIDRFVDEPAPTRFGDRLDVTWTVHRLDETPGTAVAMADFDGDKRNDIAWAGARGVELRLATRGWARGTVHQAAGVEHLLAADIDNDGAWDLVASGSGGLRAWRGDGDGLADATDRFGLGEAAGNGVVAFDFDIEGDLDLAVVRPDGMELYRNGLEGPLTPVGHLAFGGSGPTGMTAVATSDLDRDGDLDLVAVGPQSAAWLDNRRQGELAPGPTGALGSISGHAIATGDLDGDGWPEVVVAGDAGVAAFRYDTAGFVSMSLPAIGPVSSVVALDLDNDGRLDLAAGGPSGVVVLHQGENGFDAETLDGSPSTRALTSADLDGDGDLDLAASGPDGLYWLENDGGNRNGWLSVGLRGLAKGNSKNNIFGLGSSLEVRVGGAYQFREAQGGITHFGLGTQRHADILRVVWTNGVPQNRFQVARDQSIVEEQLLKGSCPFLFAWDGEQVAFVTDLLWGAPIGLPVGPGVYAGTDPSELVMIPGAMPRNGRYDLRITEELWEAAFFDAVRLWIVDHPPTVEVASNLKIVPGQAVPEAVRASRNVRPVARAWDGRGADVTSRVATPDHVYADGFERSRWQGLAARPWTFTFDLGEAPEAPIRLHLDGWIFPTDASLNLALAQRGLAPEPPRLEVETPGGGWALLLETMGFPAGKTKTMVIDTPALPPGAQRLRIVTSQWLSWDRIAWTKTPADELPVVRATLAPSVATVGFRGFSAMRRRAPNAPHDFDYARVSPDSPWLPFPGHYTRYGDVRELLEHPDDRSVILATGDELRLIFDASMIEPPPDGWDRTVFLESHGWDKDADRNTGRGRQVEPLPFRAMTSYPYGPEERFPLSPLLDAYRRNWLTRVVEPYVDPRDRSTK